MPPLRTLLWPPVGRHRLEAVVRFLAIGWPKVDTPNDEWRAVIDVNLKGVFGVAESLAAT
jgi:hypothetical protein